MELEIISRIPGEQSRRLHLLFVHGAFHAAWCWDEHFLPWFAEKGWPSHALSLRGHGMSEGRERIADWTLDDYCEDVRHAVAGIDGPVCLLGHSMGGVIAQRCWSSMPEIVGMTLIASSPLRPAPSVIMRLFGKRPLAMLRGQLFGNPRMLKRALEPMLFSTDLSPEQKRLYRNKLDSESPKAVKEVFKRNAPAPDPSDDRPVLVLGGADDWSIPQRDNAALARTYRADYQVSPGAHDIMLDPDWEESANAILNWLQTNFSSTDRI